jgi:exodeoxyribonuclease VII large subunit
MQAWRRQSDRREQRLDTAIRLLRPPSLQWAQRLTRLDQLAQRLATAGVRSTDLRQARLMKLAAALRTPELAAPRSRLEAAARALASEARAGAETAAQRLLHTATALELVSPRGVLKRGYAIVTLADGPIVRSAATLSTGDQVTIALRDGAFDATVDRTHNAADTAAGDAPDPLTDRPGR